jgi:DNA polymerase-3 subunit gamma/tau
MSYTVLARKYRPQKFSDVIGQDHVTRTLKNAIEQERIAHGYIFSGHRGIGKTTVARILAMALNCRSADKPVSEPCGVCDSCVEIRAGNAVDVIEIDAATNRGIDEIRELREAARYRPARDRFKIYILDEAHQITDAAFNALLKTLEEPPGHVIFMMATTQPEDIPQTIRSRCQHFSFHAVSFEEIVGQLRAIAKQENIEADDDAIALLAEAGDGSMRDALSIMDQAIACCAGRLTAETVRQLVGSVPSEMLEAIMGAVERNSSEDVLRLVDRLMMEGQSPTHFARQMVRFLRNATVAKVAGKDTSLLQISSDERDRVNRVAEMFSEEDLARFLQIMLRTHGELGYKQEQRFHLELGLLKLVHAQRLLPLEQLLSGEASTAPRPSGTSAHSATRAGSRTASSFQAPRATRGPSPFEADVSRKAPTPRGEISTPRSESIAPRIEAVAAPAPAHAVAVTMGAAAAAPAIATAAQAREASSDAIRDAILNGVEELGQTSLLVMLESGEWKQSGGEIVVTVPKKQAMIELTLGSEGQNHLNRLAAEAAGRPLKVRVVSGGNGNGNGESRPATSRPARGARARALEDPVVKRMQEKFGADIRTVLDHKER